MASVSASTGVKYSSSGNSLSGSTTITGTPDTGKSTTLATVTASGSPVSTKFGASNNGSSDGWKLYVTLDANGNPSGSASGNYAGLDWTPPFEVEVDAPGRSRHRRKSKKKVKARTRKAAKRTAKKKTTRKSSKPRSAVRRAKAPARKKPAARRKKVARR